VCVYKALVKSGSLGVQASFYEIRNEQIHDLFEKERTFSQGPTVRKVN
jgi:hypothetical protein